MTKTIESPERGVVLPPLPEIDAVTRREFLIGTAGLLLLPAGCGSGGDEGGEEGTPGKTRTIEHKYGTTEIEGIPERVVTVGLSDHDAVLALGVTPVGLQTLIEDRFIWPWNEDELGDAQPEILGTLGEADLLNFEQISTLEPDLILAVYSGLTEQEYNTLSQVAPTVAQPGEYIDLGVPWQEQTRVIGRALGREERAEQVVTEVEARIDEAREQHPEFEGATAVSARTNAGVYFLLGSLDPRARFLTSLGFKVPPEIDELAGDSFFAQISEERLELLDTDVLIWYGNNPEDIKDDQLYQQLDVAREGRDLFVEANVENEIYGALQVVTVLSIPFLLGELVPQIAAAVDGDPETTREETIE